MKMRKRIAALIAVAMIAALMPMATFAASSNSVTKAVTVEKDGEIDQAAAPKLKIDVKDALPTDQAFYLNVTGAEWAEVADIAAALSGSVGVGNDIAEKTIAFTVTTGTPTPTVFEAYRESDSVVEIKNMGTGDFTGKFEFPLVMKKVTGEEAFVEVEPYDTEITEGKYLFAVTDGAKATADIGTVPSLYRRGEMAKITIEEPFAEAFMGTAAADREFIIELRDTDFSFNDTNAKLTGKRAYKGLTGTVAVDTNDSSKLIVTLPDPLTGSSTPQRGLFELTGVEIVADKDARLGDVRAIIDGKIVKKEAIVVAKRADYNTVLAVAEDWEYDVVAGNEKEIVFTLSEELANSLVGTRPVTFSFTNGVKIKDEYRDKSTTDTTQVPDIAKLDDVIKISGSDVEDEDVNGDKQDDWTLDMLQDRVTIASDHTSFTVDKFQLIKDKKGSYKFTTTVLVPAGVTGDIVLKAEGKGVDEQEIIVAKAEAPVEVETTGMDIKVGLKEIETTGKIIIQETKEDRIAQGKDIILRVDDLRDGLEIKSFKATVVEGDLVLADDPYSRRLGSDEAIGVKRASTELSTIEITDIVMYTNRTVPEGKYDLLVGGDAISKITDRANKEFNKVTHHNIDPVVVVEDFINITTKNTEDISGSANKAKVAFVVGSTEYLVNGKVEQMDVAPYIKDGRTMVPVRYVAAALGVKPEQVIWDGANQTATVIADKIIQVKLGSKMMLVNGVSFPMAAAAELVSDRTFVPVAEMARALGVPVDWAAENATATFN